jgi:hypothetical protein
VVTFAAEESTDNVYESRNQHRGRVAPWDAKTRSTSADFALRFYVTVVVPPVVELVPLLVMLGQLPGLLEGAD